MSDAYFRERAARRARCRWILIGCGVVVILVLLGIRVLLYDSCTRSFDRSPRSVITTYAEAVSRGDLPVVQACWQHHTYYDLGAGCSQICLDRVSGAQYRITELTLEPETTAPDGRANLVATVSIECTQSGETHSGEILLDSVGGNVPWKHWAIIHSSFGGTVAEPWCR